MAGKKALLLLGVAGAVGVGFLLMGGKEAKAETGPVPVPPPSPEPEEPEEEPGVGPVPPGTVPDKAPAQPSPELPSDRITVDPIETETGVPITPPAAPPKVIDIPEVETGEDGGDDILEPPEKLEPIAPPFVPPEVRRPAPAPKLPIPKAPPVVEEVIDEVKRRLPPIDQVIPPPDVGPGIPIKIPAPKVPPGEVLPAPPSPPLAPETEAMLRVMLAKESTPNWKDIEPTLIAWQKARGLVADGKFGPGSAKRLAAETGLLPIVRFWPRGTLPGTAVPQFQGEILSVAAAAEEPRKTHLRAAAEREQGQGFGTPPKPISPLIEI